jgi:hypothetical protein
LGPSASTPASASSLLTRGSDFDVEWPRAARDLPAVGRARRGWKAAGSSIVCRSSLTMSELIGEFLYSWTERTELHWLDAGSAT